MPPQSTAKKRARPPGEQEGPPRKRPHAGPVQSPTRDVAPTTATAVTPQRKVRTRLIERLPTATPARSPSLPSPAGDGDAASPSPISLLPSPSLHPPTTPTGVSYHHPSAGAGAGLPKKRRFTPVAPGSGGGAVPIRKPPASAKAGPTTITPPQPLKRTNGLPGCRIPTETPKRPPPIPNRPPIHIPPHTTYTYGGIPSYPVGKPKVGSSLIPRLNLARPLPLPTCGSRGSRPATCNNNNSQPAVGSGGMGTQGRARGTEAMGSGPTVPNPQSNGSRPVRNRRQFVPGMGRGRMDPKAKPKSVSSTHPRSCEGHQQVILQINLVEPPASPPPVTEDVLEQYCMPPAPPPSPVITVEHETESNQSPEPEHHPPNPGRPPPQQHLYPHSNHRNLTQTDLPAMDLPLLPEIDQSPPTLQPLRLFSSDKS